MSTMEYSVCLLAAGKGSRTHLEYNKVFYKLENGKTVLDTCLSVFLEDEDCKEIVIVSSHYEIEYVHSLYRHNKKIQVVEGGSTRQESVSNGLEVVSFPYVFIHDGARPYIKKEQIDLCKEALKSEDACLLMVPSVDTSKIIEDGYVQKTLVRSTVYNAQTPQCFKTDLIRYCQKRAKEENYTGTDDAQLVEMFGNTRIKMVPGDPSNVKITLPTDLK